ncbi:MAG: sugar-binding domain-containing protein, partial [Spirochaetota bacterium]
MAFTAPTPPWETPEITNINRLPAGSCLVPYPDPETAASYDRTRSDWFLSLGGTWAFRLYGKPDDVPSSALDAKADESGFRSMPVPSNWTLEDTGDRPIYTNVKMPFDNTPPHVPEANPTGVYRTTFSLPGAWSGRRVVIHFGGVESYYELYVNGRFAGMAKDTRLPSEFDITRL